MKRTFCILFCYFINMQIRIVISCTYAGTVSCKCGVENSSQPSGRITDGTAVLEYETPWMAAFYFEQIFLGQGVLINDYYILTAAVIFIQVQNNILVLNLTTSNISLGMLESKYWEEDFDSYEYRPEVRSMEQLIIHPKFNPYKEYEYDIALVNLNEPFQKYTPNIVPICLPPVLYTFENTDATVAGWGGYSPDSIIEAAALLKGKYVIKSPTYCLEHFKDFNMDINLCALPNPPANASVCKFDTGTPLFWRTYAKQALLIGVLAGEGPCDPTKPAIFTRINGFLPWIKDNTKDAFYCKDRNPFQEPLTKNCDCGILVERRFGRQSREEEEGEFPWHVILTASSFIIGFGTLINNRWVVSTASVFVAKDRENNMVIVFKDIFVNTPAIARIGAKMLAINQSVALYSYKPPIFHPNFNIRVPLANDIALVQLTKELKEYKINILPICLFIKKPVNFPNNADVMVQQQADPVNQIYDVLTAKIIPEQQCSLGSAILCADTEQERQDCKVLVGSGWFYRESTHQMHLIGVTIETQCNNNQMRITATNVTKYLEWISNVTDEAHYCERDPPI